MAFDSNPEQTLADIEAAFEDSKAKRMIANNKWKAAKGTLHMKLVARREAGENLTIADMEAIQDAAINTEPEIREAYMEFIAVDSAYRAAKVKFENAKRNYWDAKDSRR